MGWNDHLDDSELGNLPQEAYGNVFDTDGPFDPDNHWLQKAEPDLQLVAMREWFLARYCDPVEETPYNGREGGYLFVDGGPYDPGEELPTRFSEIVDDEIIQELVAELYEKVGDQWAPIRSDYYDDYDERFDFHLDSRNEPLRRLRNRLQQSRQVLSLQGDPEPMALAEKLVFGSAISALESFLMETIQYWIDNDDQALNDLVTKLPVFRDEQIKLGDIFKRQQGLKAQVKGHLQNLVWHRWDKVAPLFRYGLGVELPSTKPFQEALEKRHDIVHRSGHSKDGSPIEVTAEEIHSLCSKVEAFGVEIDRSLATRGNIDLLDGAHAPDF